MRKKKKKLAESVDDLNVQRSGTNILVCGCFLLSFPLLTKSLFMSVMLTFRPTPFTPYLWGKKIVGAFFHLQNIYIIYV